MINVLPWLVESTSYTPVIRPVIVYSMPVTTPVNTPTPAEEVVVPSYDTGFDWGRAWKGTTRIAKGVGILMVPDPVPLIDEVYAVGSIAYGTFEIATSF